MKKKKINNVTKKPKIDIFNKKGYLCSTNFSKTCKDAVRRYLDKYPEEKNTGVYARFDYA